jgi:VWFA-related protein
LLRAAIQQARIVFPAGYVGGGVVVGRYPPTSTLQIGATAIWDSIIAACEQVLSAATKDSRAIVLLTDGEDTVSKAKISQAIEVAIRHNVAIYSVGIGDSKNYGLNKDALRRVSEPTGGRAFFPKIVGELQTVFDSIRSSVRSRYAITYRPNAIGGKPPRKLRIEILNPALKDVRIFYPRTVSQSP